MTALPAPAKVNLFLDVLGRRPDGYHEIHTAFCAVTLCDEVHLHPAGQREDSATHPIRSFTVRGPFADGTPTDPRNLVWRAITESILVLRQQHCRLWDTYYPRFDVELVKNIPIAAGLGGGSSDAAAALKLFQQTVDDHAIAAGYPDLQMKSEEVRRVAELVGSDVPYFLTNGFAEGKGRGEILTPLPGRELIVLIAKPKFDISTREAYSLLKPEHFGSRSDANGLREWLAGETRSLPQLFNAFEAALDPQYEELPQIRAKMIKAGAIMARLSGSGSASFGIFPDEESRNRAHADLHGECECFPCKTV